MVPTDPTQMKLKVPADIVALIRGCHPIVKRKIRAGLRHMVAEPGAGKSLKDELEGLKSYRIGRIRVIYRIASNGTVNIVAIGPRKSIYEETYRVIKKEADGKR